jgi:undecaprenyl-diphosphatase
MCGIITKILKIIIGRARPIFADPTLFNMFSQSHEFHSMPSGHTAISFAGLVMIGMLVPRMKWLTWTLAIVIAVSRVSIGAHWPTDVLLGAFVGMVSADFVLSIIRKIK